MKKILTILTILFLFSLLPLSIHAHSGGTDASGGHNGPSGYHYHHGYPAHSHVGGCPYDYDDKTGSTSGSSSGNTSYSKNNYASTYSEDDNDNTAAWIVIATSVAVGIILFCVDLFIEKQPKTKITNIIKTVCFYSFFLCIIGVIVGFCLF